MTISVDLCGRDAFKIKILKGPNFTDERDRIKKIPGKKPIYGIDPATASSIFKWWEVPRTGIAQLDSLFPRSNMIIEPAAVSLFSRFDNLQIPADELPRIEGDINWYRGPLYPCQEDYVRTNKDRNRLVSAAFCGAGKSWMGLTRANLLGFQHLLIIAPATLMTNWRSEIHKHLGMEHVVYHGTVKQRSKIIDTVLDYPIIVTSYHMIQELYDFDFEQLIFDEAHLLAHANTKIYDRAARIVKKNPDAGIQLLTGTPILHKPKDLWAPVNLIYPELAGSYKEWVDRYEEVIKSFKKKIYARDHRGNVLLDSQGIPVIRFIKEIPLITRTRNLDDLTNRVKPFLIRVKQEGLVKFEDTIEIVKVKMTERQKKFYKSIGQNIILKLDSGELKISNALSEMTRLLQVAEGAFNIEPKWKDSGKLDFVRDYINNMYPDEKIIIWSRFKPISELLYEEFKSQAVIYNGDRTKNQKNLARWAFQGVDNDFEQQEFNRIAGDDYRFCPGEARLFFGVIDKVSTLGFNLPACRRQLTTSTSWNGNINGQAWARIKRPEQQADEVFTTILASENSIDESSLQTMLGNLKNCQNVLDGEESISTNQTSELIRELRNSLK